MGKQRKSAAITGFVYFVLNRDREAVRIGFSATPHDRLKEFQTACPDRLELTLIVPGDPRTERAMTTKFAGCHIREGWYDARKMAGILFGSNTTT